MIEQEGILATKLCTHKENVNQINEIHLSRLPGDKRVFQAMDSDSSMCTMLDSQVPVGQTLELKEGAQVRSYNNVYCKLNIDEKILLLSIFIDGCMSSNILLGMEQKSYVKLYRTLLLSA